MSEESFRIYNLDRDNISKVTTSLCFESRGRSYCRFKCTGCCSDSLGSSMQALAVITNFRKILWVDPKDMAKEPGLATPVKLRYQRMAGRELRNAILMKMLLASVIETSSMDEATGKITYERQIHFLLGEHYIFL